jgi:hypothetical protein
VSATPEQDKPLKSDFMAAEDIKGILGHRDKAEQERIVRWVAESLGLPLAPGGIATPPAIASPQQPAAPAAQGGTHAHAASGSLRAKDLKTFATEKNPKSDVQFAATVAYYYRFEAPLPERKDTINAQDLQNATRLAGRDRFTDPYVPLNNARTQGYLDRVGGGAFSINAVGENLVAMALPGTPAESRKASKRKPAGKHGK